MTLDDLLRMWRPSTMAPPTMGGPDWFGDTGGRSPNPSLPLGTAPRFPSIPSYAADIAQLAEKLANPDLGGLEQAAAVRTNEALRQLSGMAGAQGLLGSSLQMQAAADIASKIQAETAAEVARRKMEGLQSAVNALMGADKLGLERFGLSNNLLGLMLGYDINLQKLLLEKILAAAQLGAKSPALPSPVNPAVPPPQMPPSPSNPGPLAGRDWGRPTTRPLPRPSDMEFLPGDRLYV